MLPSVNEDHTFLRGGEEDAFNLSGFLDPAFGLEGALRFGKVDNNNFPVPQLFPLDNMYEKANILGPNLLLNQQQIQSQQSPALFMHLPQLPIAHQQHLHAAKRRSVDAFFGSGVVVPEQSISRNIQQQQQQQTIAAPSKLPVRSTRPEFVAVTGVASGQQQEVMVDQLFKAAELVEAGNSVSAREILARLNHQISSPAGKPILRSVFYFKEALQLLTCNGARALPSNPVATPLDVVLKLSTYKTFSDVSPIVQFTNFTTIQALLEELGTAQRIHIIDFDIGVGVQWSAFMQELSERRSAANSAAPMLKITAFVPPSFYCPFELHLIQENLCHFAAQLKIPFEFNALSLNPFDPSSLLRIRAGANEALAVNLPVGAAMHQPISTLIRLVKQLSPRIVITVDKGSDRSELPFAHHFFHAFQSCTVLLDSVDAAGTSQDAINKIELFLVQPWVENVVLGRHRAAEKTMPWRTVFSSLGFVSLQLSNFAETQAECLLKRVQVRGFHVEKHQSSLSLYWQRSELVSVSGWKC